MHTNALVDVKCSDQTTKLAPVALNLSHHLFLSLQKVMMACPDLLTRERKGQRKRGRPTERKTEVEKGQQGAKL